MFVVSLFFLPGIKRFITNTTANVMVPLCDDFELTKLEHEQTTAIKTGSHLTMLLKIEIRQLQNALSKLIWCKNV